MGAKEQRGLQLDGRGAEPGATTASPRHQRDRGRRSPFRSCGSPELPAPFCPIPSQIYHHLRPTPPGAHNSSPCSILHGAQLHYRPGSPYTSPSPTWGPYPLTHSYFHRIPPPGDAPPSSGTFHHPCPTPTWDPPQASPITTQGPQHLPVSCAPCCARQELPPCSTQGPGGARFGSAPAGSEPPQLFSG